MARTDCAGEAFLRALDEADRGAPAAVNGGSRRPRRPEAPACADFRRDEGGGQALWDFALEWTDDRGPPLAPSDPARGPDLSLSETAAVAKELGFGVVMTAGQLASCWRDFIWRNHPDRQPAQARLRADARVAIANALYDEARRKLAQTG